jgi:hypothetical protein
LDLIGQLDVALRDARSGTDWRERLFSVHQRARQLMEKRPDGSLYYLVFEAGNTTVKYSCSHALLTLLICEQAAPLLGWSQAWIDSLGRAALTMNVAMLRLQDQTSQLSVSPAMRAEIDAHAQAGAKLLQQAGLNDALCQATVALHHDASQEAAALGSLAPERQLARLLRRVDIFTAKLRTAASLRSRTWASGLAAATFFSDAPWRSIWSMAAARRRFQSADSDSSANKGCLMTSSRLA